MRHVSPLPSSQVAAYCTRLFTCDSRVACTVCRDSAPATRMTVCRRGCHHFAQTSFCRDTSRLHTHNSQARQNFEWPAVALVWPYAMGLHFVVLGAGSPGFGDFQSSCLSWEGLNFCGCITGMHAHYSCCTFVICSFSRVCCRLSCTCTLSLSWMKESAV